MNFGDLRDDLLAGFHILDEEGQNSGIAGHVTARLQDRERLLGHRYGYAFDEVRAGDIFEADFDLDTGTEDRVSPSLAFHVSIYRVRADIGAVVHTHGFHALALGAAGEAFRPVYQSALMLWDRVRLYDRYDGIIENDEVGRHMAAALGDGSVLALRNHGIVAVGRNVREAVCAAVIYEENCAIQLAALAGQKIKSLGGPEAEQARDFLVSERVIQMRWDQLRRKAAGTRPFLTEAI
ncbi:MAG: class II aldolase/adducin family protein [Paracoccaceae bacterium]|nr:class II aldolase/adducin family protein [Paracoccaceae bacterium]